MNTPIATELEAPSRDPEPIFFGRFRNKRQILALLLFALTLLAYNSASHFQFLNYDDPQYVIENDHVHMGLHWSTIRWAFTTFEFFNWHPLTWISFLIDYQFFGLKPAGYHFMNVVYHATAAVLLFLVLHKGTARLAPSFVVAVLFALHPLNVESVAWIAERKNVLSTVFWFLAIWAYGWYALRPGWKRYCLVAVCFALGLMSKPMVITLPCALLLLDVWPLHRVKNISYSSEEHSETSLKFVPASWQELVLEKVPLFLLSAVSAVLTFHAQLVNQGMGTMAAFPLGMRIENAIFAYAGYIWKAFLPWNLAVFYPHPGYGIPLWKLILSLVILVGTTLVVVRAGKRQPYLPVGWFWFLGILVPVIGLFQNGDQAMADRYTYVPLVGIFVMLIWGAAEWLERTRSRRIAGIVLALAVFAILTAALEHQLQYWHDSISLFSHATSVTRENATAEMNWGEALSALGREKEALPHNVNAVHYRPQDANQHYNYGRSLFFNGKPEEAIAEFNRVLQLGASQAITARTYHNMAGAYLSLGKRKEAKTYYELATRLNPEGYRSYLMLGVLQFEDSEFSPAQRNLEQSVQLLPSDVAYLDLGKIYERQGRLQDARTAFEKAAQISPSFKDIQQNLDEVQQRLRLQKNSMEAATPAAS